MDGVGDQIRIEGRFTAAKYLQILDEFLLPSLRRHFPDRERPLIYVQDRSPIHMARAVREWFVNHRHELTTLEWPPKGCDCNPIENVWGYLVNGWDKERERNPHQLMAHIDREWERLRTKPHIIYNMVASMPERLQEVITRNGGWTHY